SGALQGSGIGGGIELGGTVEIRNSTISGNTASGNGSGSGGGMFIGSGGIVTVTNSTISGNLAGVSGGGIGINSNSGATLTIIHSTISDNRASMGGGIANSGSGAVLEIGNTILKAGVAGANIVNDGGTITSRGYNLSSDN